MYLSRVHIRNFRSVKDLDIRFNLGRNIIVGRNNAGKTNIFKAIDMVMGERNPIYKNENFTQKDFYYWLDKESGEFSQAEDMFIWCEIKKLPEDVIDFAELHEKIHLLPLYGEWFTNSETNGREKRLKTLSLADPVSAWKEIARIEETNFNRIWLSPREDQYRNIISKSEKIIFLFYARIDESGEIDKEMRMLIQGDTEGIYYLAFRAAIRSELMNSAVLPSFRDPNNQLKLNNYSWFGKMIRDMVRRNPLTSQLDGAFEQANEIAGQMFSDVKEDFEKELSYVFPDSLLHFQLSVDRNDDLYKSLKIYVDDGYKSDIHDKGAGFQSSFVINMFKRYIDMSSGSKSAILCIEEPELFLHPHARRALSKQIQSFVDKGSQAILTTHSTDFVSDADVSSSIISTRKTPNGTKAKVVSLRDYKNLFVYNYQSEIFFADKVLICEGYDAYVIRAVAEYYFPSKIDTGNISIVSVQGKDQIPEFVKLLLSLDIPCYVMADFDFLLRDTADDRKLYSAKAHKSAESLPSGFFKQRLEKSDGDKIYSRIQKFRAYIKSGNSEAFYKCKTLEELISSTTVSEGNYASLKNDLSRAGLFILDTEIEGLFQNDDLINVASREKFDSDAVFDLHTALNNGRRITEYLVCEDLRNMIGQILGMEENELTPSAETIPSQ